MSVSSRKLLATGLRDSICTIDGVLFDSNLHPVWLDCHNIVGLVLVEPKCHTGTSGVGRHNCADHDHPHVFDQRSAS